MSEIMHPAELAQLAAQVYRVAEALHQLAAASDLAAVSLARLAAAERDQAALRAVARQDPGTRR